MAQSGTLEYGGGMKKKRKLLRGTLRSSSADRNYLFRTASNVLDDCRGSLDLGQRGKSDGRNTLHEFRNWPVYSGGEGPSQSEKKGARK